MGLTNQVRDFFTNRINGALDAQKSEVMTAIAQKADIRKLTMQYADGLFPEAKLSETIDAFATATAEYERASRAKDAAKEAAREALRRVGCDASYCPDPLDAVRSVTAKYQMKAIAKHFPKEKAQLDKINKARGDIEGAIILATTEQKLVCAMTAVLERYGGDLGDLKSVVGLE